MDLTELRRTIISCKESITSAAEDLTKLTGRNYDKSSDVNRQFSNVPIVSRDNFKINQRLTIKRQNNYDNEYQIESKRSRNDKEIHSINSVVQVTKGRTRNDALHDMKTIENPKEKERCKRLFGHLMGTLNSIKKESEKASNDPQNITRLKIEKKVEEDHKIMSETIQKEQNELIRAKRERENELKNLNQRYRAAEAFERWRLEKEKMKGFIRTSKAPYIFYKPKTINEEAQLRIDETARAIDVLIETRKTKLAGDIERVVKKHQGVSRDNKLNEGFELNDTITAEPFIGSTVSVINNSNGRNRAVSPANSFDSEDYDDMIEEIEISMHDDPVQIHDDIGRLLVDKDNGNVVRESDIYCTNDELNAKEPTQNIAEETVVVCEERVEVEDQIMNIEEKKIDEESTTMDVDVDHNMIHLGQVDQVLIDTESIIAIEEVNAEEKKDDIVTSAVVDIDQVAEVPESSQD